jgi:hypothetical protein
MRSRRALELVKMDDAEGIIISKMMDKIPV